MTSLPASALENDEIGLVFLQDVIGWAPDGEAGRCIRAIGGFLSSRLLVTLVLLALAKV